MAGERWASSRLCHQILFHGQKSIQNSTEILMQAAFRRHQQIHRELVNSGIQIQPKPIYKTGQGQAQETTKQKTQGKIKCQQQ